MYAHFLALLQKGMPVDQFEAY